MNRVDFGGFGLGVGFDLVLFGFCLMFLVWVGLVSLLFFVTYFETRVAKAPPIQLLLRKHPKTLRKHNKKPSTLPLSRKLFNKNQNFYLLKSMSKSASLKRSMSRGMIVGKSMNKSTIRILVLMMGGLRLLRNKIVDKALVCCCCYFFVVFVSFVLLVLLVFFFFFFFFLKLIPSLQPNCWKWKIF